MRRVLRRAKREVDALLGGDEPRGSVLLTLGCLVVFGLAHGAMVGSYTGVWAGQPLQIVYSALKLPLLLVVTFAVALPSFFVLNTLAGLREDWPRVLRMLLASQAALAVVVASLGPLLLVAYASTGVYPPLVLLNAGLFLVASVAAQGLLRRWYAPLVERDVRHRLLRVVWLVLYGFVGIQAGYTLRPFIGSPGSEVTFFRQQAWQNAYVAVWRLLADSIGL